jgi:hypothetical protein
MAGLIWIEGPRWSLHLLVKPSFWWLPWRREIYEGLGEVGLGPLFLFVS